MLEVQRIYSSQLLLPLSEVRSWYPKQDFNFCQIQSPPYYLDNRLCNPLTTSHWLPVAHEASPLCLQMESVCSTLLCWQLSLSVRQYMGVSQRSHCPNCQQLQQRREPRKAKDKQGEGRMDSAQSNSFNTSGRNLSWPS